MSIRREPEPTTGASFHAQQLRRDIENMRYAAAAAEEPSPETMATAEGAEHAAIFDSLTETEKSAATIGASPSVWKPIGWMNTAHYTTLLKKNALAGRLTQQIEAYKVVSGPQ